MDDLPTLVSAFFASKSVREELAAVNKLIMHLSLQPAHFVPLLETLSPTIGGQAPDDDTAKSLRLIGEVIAKVKTIRLTLLQQELLLTFFLQRCKKLSLVDAATKCLELLYTSHLFPPTADKDSASLGYAKLSELLNGSFWITSAYSQPIRHRIYSLLLALLNHHPWLLNPDKHQSFIATVMEHTDEERDPRNLFVILQIWHAVLTRFPPPIVQQFAETIFDRTNVYFPVIFKNKSLTSTLTVDDLNTALNKCLSHPLLVDKFIELIFEKLVEEDEEVRNAALNGLVFVLDQGLGDRPLRHADMLDRKSTRLNSSH